MCTFCNYYHTFMCYKKELPKRAHINSLFDEKLLRMLDELENESSSSESEIEKLRYFRNIFNRRYTGKY